MLFLSRNQVQILSSKPKSYLVLAKSEYTNAFVVGSSIESLVGSFRMDTYDVEGGVSCARELTIRAQPVPAPTFWTQITCFQTL